MTTDFGREMSCTDTLKTGRFVTGPRLVAEADFRRLTTPRGMLRGGEEEQNYGLDLTAMVGGSGSEATAAALPGQITSELMKDERHESVDVTVVRTVDGAAVTFDVTIEGQTSEGPFTLKLRASDVTVELLGIS